VQSAAAAHIYKSLQKRFPYTVVAGDFNDYRTAAPWMRS
jgi:hypothetical protein